MEQSNSHPPKPNVKAERNIYIAMTNMLEAAGPLFVSPRLQQSLNAERTQVYLDDRAECLETMDIQAWRRFCLRWGILPPPNGWGDAETVLGLMHMTRLVLPQSSGIQKLSSAHWLVAHKVRLPGTYQLRDGILTGGLPDAR